MTLSVILSGIVWYIAFVLSTTVHEAAHALAALVGGDPTAYRQGQVSLNPVPHMRREPFGMILIPLLGLFTWGGCMGWASTPYDPMWERRYPRRAAWMAAAGPAANLVIAILALLALRAGLASGFFFAPDSIADFSGLVGADSPILIGLGRFLSILVVLNTILFVLNLIPFPPLDGATVITLFLSDDAALRIRDMLSSPQVGFIGLLIVFLLFGEVVPWLWGAVVFLVHPDVSYQ